MPCSFCRSHEHNIRYCNSPMVSNIVSQLSRDANRHTMQFDYRGFATIVHRMPLIELKIAALFWHTTIPAADYESLLLDGDSIPVIQCNYARDKYFYIVLWLYLDYTFSTGRPAIVSAQHTSMERISIFLERLEFLRRIVIEGMTVIEASNLFRNSIRFTRLAYVRRNVTEDMTHMQSADSYRNVIRTSDGGNSIPRPRFQSPTPVYVPRRIDFDNYQYDPAALGFTNYNALSSYQFNNKFEFIIEELGDSSDFAKEPNTDCPICYDTLTTACVKLGCAHHICSGCFILYLKTRNNPNICCSLCRADILSVKTYDEELIPDLRKYSTQPVVDPEPEIQMPEPHVPERFEDGDNIIINLV